MRWWRCLRPPMVYICTRHIFGVSIPKSTLRGLRAIIRSWNLRSGPFHSRVKLSPSRMCPLIDIFSRCSYRHIIFFSLPRSFSLFLSLFRFFSPGFFILFSYFSPLSLRFFFYICVPCAPREKAGFVCVSGPHKAAHRIFPTVVLSI